MHISWPRIIWYPWNHWTFTLRNLCVPLTLQVFVTSHFFVTFERQMWTDVQSFHSCPDIWETSHLHKPRQNHVSWSWWHITQFSAARSHRVRILGCTSSARGLQSGTSEGIAWCGVRKAGFRADRHIWKGWKWGCWWLWSQEAYLEFTRWHVS